MFLYLFYKTADRCVVSYFSLSVLPACLQKSKNLRDFQNPSLVTAICNSDIAVM